MESTANPLSSITERFPLQALRGASIAGRLFGAGLIASVAFEQSYDPTQVFTLVLAAFVLATLVQVPGAVGDWLAAFGSGAVFFAGAVLTHLGAGPGLLALGLVAGLAGFAFAARSGRDALFPAVVFVASAFVTGALQVAIVFWFE